MLKQKKYLILTKTTVSAPNVSHYRFMISPPNKKYTVPLNQTPIPRCTTSYSRFKMETRSVGHSSLTL